MSTPPVSTQMGERSQGMYNNLSRLHNPLLLFGTEAREDHLRALPESIRQKIFWHIYDLSGRPAENQYGKRHVFDSQSKLEQAIQRVAFECFDTLSQEDKKGVAGRIWYRWRAPIAAGANWGENHAKADVQILLASLHDHQLLKKIGEWVEEASSSERNGRNEAKRRIIQFINNLLNPPFNTNLHTLNLSNLALTSLPLIFSEEPFAKHLETLNLSGNQLTYLPSEIGRLVAKELIFSINHRYFVEKIDEWVEEAPYSERNGRKEAKRRIIQFINNSLDPRFNNNFPNLDLSYLGLKNLPLIFSKEPFVSKLKVLFLSGNQMTDLPSEIRRLVALTFLDLSQNQLSQLPAEISGLVALTNLGLSQNQLSQLPAEISGLVALTNLDLSQNQLSQLPAEISGLVALTNLDLSQNQLTHLPPEIGQLPLLRNLKLSYNSSLAGLPNQIFDLPHFCNVRLESTGLSISVLNRLRAVCDNAGYQGPSFSYSMERGERQRFIETLPLPELRLESTGLSISVLNRLRAVCDNAGYQGPSFSYSMERGERQRFIETLPLPELMSQLFSIAKQPQKDFPTLLSLPEGQQTTLRSWLSRLSDTADYKKKGAFQENFAQKIVTYLTQAENDAQFRELFFLTIQDASATCGDRVALSILYLDLAVQLATIGRKDISRLATFLICTVWPVEILEKMAREKIPTLSFFDEIEVYLGYPIQLRKSLSLEISVEDMLYFRCSALTSKDLKEAEDKVKEMQNDEEKRLDFLLGRKEWMEALQATYPQQFKEIETEIEAAKNNCETNEDYIELDAEGKQKWKVLSALALGSENQPISSKGKAAIAG